MEKNNIVEEFLKGADIYTETLEAVNEKGMCPICGMKAESIKKLAEEIKKLEKKAWMYDDLCE